MSERLENALRAARDTRVCVIGEDVLAQVPAIIRDQFPGDGAAVVVADPRTWQAAGAQVDTLVVKNLTPDAVAQSIAAMEKASVQAERAGKIIRRTREFVKKNA